MRILEERAYERAYRSLKAARQESDVPMTPMVQMVKTMQAESWQAKMQALSEYNV